MKLTLYIFVLLSFEAFSQNGWESASLDEFSTAILNAESRIGENESFSYEAEYNFYEELTSEQPEMTLSASLICSKSNEIYMSQFGRLMVQDQSLNVVCDTATKMVIISESKEEYLKRKSSSDYEILLKGPSTLKKKKDGTGVKYYLEFPKGGQYMAAELWFGNSGQVNKYILYTAEEIFDDSKVEDRYIRPRMEINYSKYRSGTQVQIDEMLHIDDFVIVNKENVLLQPAYSTYQLIDLRTSNN